MKDRSTEYMYGSARVRAMENGIIGNSRLRALIDSRSLSDALEKLSSFGLKLDRREDGAVIGADTALAEILRTAYTEICEMYPDTNVFEWLRYPYDCNNLKLAIKCRIRNLSADELMFGFGSVGAAATIDSVFSGDYTAFPKNMAEAAALATDEYSRTRDPRVIDTLIDRACYSDMLECAMESGEAVFVNWVKTKIDLTNIMTTLRMMRMNNTVGGRIFLEGALLPNGEIPTSDLLAAYDDGEETLFYQLSVGKYSGLAADMKKTDASLSSLERCCDNYYMNLIKAVKWMPFGAPLLAAYLIAREYEVKNIRIILAAKDAGLGADVIFERLRESYV